MSPLISKFAFFFGGDIGYVGPADWEARDSFAEIHSPLVFFIMFGFANQLSAGETPRFFRRPWKAQVKFVFQDSLTRTRRADCEFPFLLG